MGKYKYFAKNMGLLTVSNFTTKMLSFLLVPLYTHILSTTEYGTYDLINTTIGLLLPLLSLDIVDATMRFSMDKCNDKKEIFSISLRYINYSNIAVFIALFLNHFFGLSMIIDDYYLFVFLLFIVTSINSVFVYFARGIEKIADLSISSVVSTLFIIVFNIFFMVYLKWGIFGYFLANIIGLLSQVVFLFFKLKIWNYIQWSNPNRRLNKEMISYSRPLIANSIAWWINNASDRYMVTWLISISANGIYSVSYKIPSILNVFQTIFTQAWTLSAVKDYDSVERNQFYTTMYRLYNCSMTIICSFLIAGTKILARLLYAKEFYDAWRYVPLLLIAIVFGALSGYIGGIFAAIKASKIFSRTTVVGAVTNIILNFILISYIGTMGAAIATAVSFWVVWEMRIKYLKKELGIEIRKKSDYIAYVILIIQTLCFFAFENNIICVYTLQSILLIIMLCFYRIELKLVMKKVFFIMGGKKK